MPGPNSSEEPAEEVGRHKEDEEGNDRALHAAGDVALRAPQRSWQANRGPVVLSGAALCVISSTPWGRQALRHLALQVSHASQLPLRLLALSLQQLVLRPLDFVGRPLRLLLPRSNSALRHRRGAGRNNNAVITVHEAAGDAGAAAQAAGGAADNNPALQAALEDINLNAPGAHAPDAAAAAALMAVVQGLQHDHQALVALLAADQHAAAAAASSPPASPAKPNFVLISQPSVSHRRPARNSSGRKAAGSGSGSATPQPVAARRDRTPTRNAGAGPAQGDVSPQPAADPAAQPHPMRSLAYALDPPFVWSPDIDVPRAVQAHWTQALTRCALGTLDESMGQIAADGADGGPEPCISEIMSVASFKSDEKYNSMEVQDLDACDSSGEDSFVIGDGNMSILGLPSCVGQHLLGFLDADGIRTLRLVCKSLYFEASKTIGSLVVTPSSLELLVMMPLHTVMPHLHTLVFKAAPPAGSDALPAAYYGPRQPLIRSDGQVVVAAPSSTASAAPPGDAGQEAGVVGSFTPAATTAMLQRLFREVLPHLKELRVLDFSDAPIHAISSACAALVEALPAFNPARANGSSAAPRVPSHTVHILLREHSAWARGAMGLLGTEESLRDTTDHFPELYEAVKRANRHLTMVARHAVQHVPLMADPVAQHAAVAAATAAAAALPPPVCIDLMGVTVRRNTAVRLPQLCGLQCITSLTLYGKSAAAATHGHRLASHLGSVASLKHLTRLELVSYEDVSDMELAPLVSCTRLQHLYLDSLFIKQASGPVFPSLTSLTAARIKFILRPLTTIFPALTHLRLGVLHSELNKKISSASLSCLAGCAPQLSTLCVCPVLWKGQWQVLPTLPGLTTLQLAHCRDLSHLREVLRVVGRAPVLQRLELHSASAAVPAWPGAAADGDGGAAAPPAQGGAGDVAGLAAAAGNAVLGAGGDAEAALVAMMTAAAAAEVASVENLGGGSVLEANLWQGLAGNRNLRSLVIAESSGRLVRHLAGAELPCLTHLEFRRLGPALRLHELQAAVVALPAVQRLVIHASGDFSAATAMQLPQVLARPKLEVEWRSSCPHAPLLYARDCGVPLFAEPTAISS